MRTSLAIAVLLSAATIAQGYVSVYTDPPVDVGGGLLSYTVHLLAYPAKDAVVAFDGFFLGEMNQVKAFGVLDTPTLTNADFLDTTGKAQDSHFLFTDDQLILVEWPTETTSRLTGFFALVPAAVKVDLPLAQIVIRQGGHVAIYGYVSNAEGTEFPIPEPCALSLLGLGAVIVRRRR